VVERRLPTRAVSPATRIHPFRFGTRCHILAISITFLQGPRPGRWATMDQNPQAETHEELVTETLVEEVSIDGMCGVY
jgi:mycofactocin precursor peptide MftA